jgi:two-component system, NarL family, sensor histidine kinase UhpB
VATSLRLRLIISLTLVFVVILALGSAMVYWHAGHKVDVELRAAVAVGMNTVHNAVDDVEEAVTPLRQLQLLVADFDGDRHLRVALLDPHGKLLYQSTPLAPTDPSPQWFYRLLARQPESIPVPLPDPFNRFGVIRLQADARNEISEVWDDAVLTLTMLLVFCTVGAGLIYWVTGRALRPLSEISAAFDRLGEGHYGTRITEDGPLELAQVSRGLNRLAAQLGQTESRRLRLEQQLAAVQEEERAELARDLHDEIGPLLFAVGADLAVIQHEESVRGTPLASRVSGVRESIARIYQDIKAILNRLRTGTPQLELGLAQAVHNLLAFWRTRYPSVTFECEVTDEDFGSEVDDALYHVVMESLSNALRHGHPSVLAVRISAQDDQIVATVRDNGVGFDAGVARADGFGIGSMERRVAALGGWLTVLPARDGPGVTVTAKIPLTPSTEHDAGTEALHTNAL